MHLLLLVLPRDELFQDFLEILDFPVFSVLEQIVDHRVFEGVEDVKHAFTHLRSVMLKVGVNVYSRAQDVVDRVLIATLKRFSFALFSQELLRETWVQFSHLDHLGILKIEESGVSCNACINRVPTLG